MAKKRKIRVITQKEIADNLEGLYLLNDLVGFGITNVELKRQCLKQVKKQLKDQGIVTRVEFESKKGTKDA